MCIALVLFLQNDTGCHCHVFCMRDGYGNLKMSILFRGTACQYGKGSTQLIPFYADLTGQQPKQTSSQRF